MKECLNCGYERQPKDEGIVSAKECPQCGILYDKIKDGNGEFKDAAGIFLSSFQSSKKDTTSAPPPTEDVPSTDTSETVTESDASSGPDSVYTEKPVEQFLRLIDEKVLPVYCFLAVAAGILFLFIGSCISSGVTFSPNSAYYPAYAFLTDTSAGNQLRITYTVAALLYGAYTFIWRFEDLGLIKTLGASCAMVWTGMLPNLIKAFGLIIK